MKNKYDSLSEYRREKNFFLKFVVLTRIMGNGCLQRSLKAIGLSAPIPRQRIINLAEYFILALSFLTVFALTLSTLSHKEMSLQEIVAYSLLMPFVFILISGKDFLFKMPITTSFAVGTGFLIQLKFSLLILAGIISGAIASVIFIMMLVKMYSLAEKSKDTNRT